MSLFEDAGTEIQGLRLLSTAVHLVDHDDSNHTKRAHNNQLEI